MAVVTVATSPLILLAISYRFDLKLTVAQALRVGNEVHGESVEALRAPLFLKLFERIIRIIPMNKKSLPKLSILLCLVPVVLSSCGGDPDTANSPEGLVIPFVIENGYMMVEATMSGKSGKFMFDSGASMSYVPEADMTFPSRAFTYLKNGRRMSEIAHRVESVEFSNGSVRASSWLVRNKQKFPPGIERVLGNGIFAGYWVEISFSGSEIVLHEQFPERFTGASHAPLTIGFLNQPFLPIEIDAREFLMAVDTGLPAALFFSEVIAEGMDPVDLRQVVSSGEVRNFYLMRTNSLSVMDIICSDKFIMGNSYTGARDPSNAHYGLMGIGFLRHYDLLLDYRTILPDTTNDDSAGMFYLPITPPEERDYGFFSFLDAAPEFGIIEIKIIEEGIGIRSLLEDSEAYALGLRPDSVITKLDGIPAGSFLPDETLDPYFYDRFTEFTALIDGVEVVLRRER